MSSAGRRDLAARRHSDESPSSLSANAAHRVSGGPFGAGLHGGGVGLQQCGVTSLAQSIPGTGKHRRSFVNHELQLEMRDADE